MLFSYIVGHVSVNLSKKNLNNLKSYSANTEGKVYFTHPLIRGAAKKILFWWSHFFVRD